MLKGWDTKMTCEVEGWSVGKDHGDASELAAANGLNPTPVHSKNSLWKSMQTGAWLIDWLTDWY